MRRINRILGGGAIRITKNNTYRGTFSKVKEKDSVIPVSSSNSSDNNFSKNQIVNFDMYYEHMQDQRTEYKNFYKNEQELESCTKSFEESDEDIFEIITKFVDAYNNALVSLKEFDKLFDTNHAENILSLLKDYEYSMEDVGIKLFSDGQLLIYKNTLKETIATSKESIEFLIGFDYGIFFKIQKIFQKVKIPSKKVKYENLSGHGNIIDTKCWDCSII